MQTSWGVILPTERCDQNGHFFLTGSVSPSGAILFGPSCTAPRDLP
ncbi:MAG: hypothetical protein QOI89_3497 [Solirubrobacteraceae bacterium]|jgi:hypothetical protein|nr:hypothetical protein [Solirubrobacteraceae bacterium]